MKEFFKRLKPGDFIAVAAVLLAAVVVWLCFFKSGGSRVKIVCGDKVYGYSLGEEREITLENNGITLKVLIKDGTVSVAESQCRDKICVHTKAISSGSIVCLPAQIIITVESGDGYDYIAG